MYRGTDIMTRNINKDNSGFTIIEVLIVLAIAGLIMAVVLFAVPGLQRSQANSAARTDASHIATAVANWSDNNGGALPSSPANLQTIYGDAGSFSKLGNQSSDNLIATITPTTVPSSGWYLASSVTTVSALSSSQSSSWIVVVDTGVACNTTASYGPSITLNTGTSTQAVVLYTSQTSGAPNWNCLQAE